MSSFRFGGLLHGSMPLFLRNGDSKTSCCIIYRRKVQTVVKATSRVDKFSKSDIIISPSILSANFAKLGEQVP